MNKINDKQKLWDTLEQVTNRLEGSLNHRIVESDLPTDEIANNRELIREARSILEEVDERDEYEVMVCRTSYAFNTIRVKAHNEEEAERLAIDRAGDHLYNEKDADYLAESVTLVEEESHGADDRVQS